MQYLHCLNQQKNLDFHSKITRQVVDKTKPQVKINLR